jgi:hypothetical protein
VEAERQGDGAGERQPQLALLLQHVLGQWKRKEKIETWSGRRKNLGVTSTEAQSRKRMKMINGEEKRKKKRWP